DHEQVGDTGVCRVHAPILARPPRRCRRCATLLHIAPIRHRRRTDMADTDTRIALLIDADNAPAAKIDLVLNEVARHGVANVRRAYGNWKSSNLKGWEAVLHEYAIRPIQQFAYSSGKNASDMAMVIDAMDLLYARNLDAFAIVSSDADFTPLVMRLLTDGMKVYGFGEKKTPAP